MNAQKKMIKLLFVLIIVLSSYFLLLPMLVDGATILPTWIMSNGLYRELIGLLYIAIVLFSLVGLFL